MAQQAKTNLNMYISYQKEKFNLQYQWEYKCVLTINSFVDQLSKNCLISLQLCRIHNKRKYLLTNILLSTASSLPFLWRNSFLSNKLVIEQHNVLTATCSAFRQNDVLVEMESEKAICLGVGRHNPSSRDEVNIITQYAVWAYHPATLLARMMLTNTHKWHQMIASGVAWIVFFSKRFFSPTSLMFG